VVVDANAFPGFRAHQPAASLLYFLSTVATRMVTA
jgi:hypothetical protein